MTAHEHTDETGLAWRKASRSTAGNDCVEVAQTTAGYLIRDSKNPEGSRLPLDIRAWAALIGDIRDGRYDL